MIINKDTVEKVSKVVPKQEIDNIMAEVVENYKNLDDILDVTNASAIASIAVLQEHAKEYGTPSGKDLKDLMLDAWIALKQNDEFFRTLKDVLTRKPGSRIVIKEDRNISTAAITPTDVILYNPDFLKAAIKYYEVTKPKLNLTPRGKVLLDALKRMGYSEAEALAALEILIHEASHFRHGDLALMKLRSKKYKDPTRDIADNIAGDIKINNFIRKSFGFPLAFGLVSESRANSTQGEILEEVYKRLKKNQSMNLVPRGIDDTHNPSNYEGALPLPDDFDLDKAIKERSDRIDKDAQQAEPEKPQGRTEETEEAGRAKQRKSNLDVEVEPKGKINPPDWKEIIKQIATKIKQIRVKETITKPRRTYLPQLQHSVEHGRPAPIVPGERIDINTRGKAIIFAIDTSGSTANRLPAVLAEMVVFTKKKLDKNTKLYIAMLGAKDFELIEVTSAKSLSCKVVYSKSRAGRKGKLDSMFEAEFGGTDIPENFIQFVSSFQPPNIGVVLITDADVASIVSPNKVKELYKATKRKLVIVVPQNDYLTVTNALAKILPTKNIASFEVID